MAQAEHHGAGPLDLDRPVDVVDAGGQQQVLAACQLGVDRLGRVARAGHEEVGQREGATRGPTLDPRGAARAGRRVGHPHPVGAGAVGVEPRLLTAQRGGLEGRVRRVGEGVLGGCAQHAGEHLVPDPVAPAVDLAVADQPLLLRPVDDEGQLRVGDETTTGELRPGGAVVHQRQVAAGDGDPAHRDGLAHRPEVGRGTAAVLPRGVDRDGEVGDRAPEVVEGDAVARAAVAQAAVVDLDLAVDDDVTGLRAQPGDLGVVADLDLQRLARRAVGAGPEEQAPAVGAHLVVDLRGVHGVGRGLDLARRHARVEDQHVRPEPGVGAQRGGRGGDGLAATARRRNGGRGCRDGGGCRQRARERGRQDEPPERDGPARAGLVESSGSEGVGSHALTFRRHPAPVRGGCAQPHHEPPTPARRAAGAVEGDADAAPASDPARCRVRRPGRAPPRCRRRWRRPSRTAGAAGSRARCRGR